MPRLDLKAPRYRSFSLRGPITLFVVVLVCVVTLTVLWNVVLVHDYQKLRTLAAQEVAFHWAYVALGSGLFLAIIVLSSILGAKLIDQIRWSQRQSDLIASVSHELNSPLSSIKLFAQTLRQPDLRGEDRQDFVAKILSDVERLQRLIANILRAAEVDNAGAALQVVPQTTELGAYLRSYVADARTLYRESALQLELEGDRDDEPRLGEHWVRLDRLMFRQVLDNLIDNAVRYAGAAAPRVSMSLAAVGSEVVIRAVDHGIGATGDDLPFLFDRFFRVGPTPSGRPRGTGIGLFVVRSILHAHGGRAWADSDGPGTGLTVSLSLPTVPPTAEPPRRRAPEAAAEASPP